MVTSKEDVVSSGQIVSSLCNPAGLARDGVVEKRDFVCWPKGSPWVYFMKPKNPEQTPMISHDGEPKFVKSLSDIKNFGKGSLAGYLDTLAKRYEMAVRRVNVKNPVEEIWQFC